MVQDWLDKTAEIMTALGIRIRDTYDRQFNRDDLYSHGKLGGPRLLRIEWTRAAPYSRVIANKVYEVPEFESVAYDGYRIQVPIRLQKAGREDPIVHECAHFLQHCTLSEDARYIPFTGDNLLEYLMQRVELEAHAVQATYVLWNCIKYSYWRLGRERYGEMLSKVERCKASPAATPDLVLASKDAGLI